MRSGGPCGKHCKQRLRRECWDTPRHPEGANSELVGVNVRSEEPQAYNCIECAIKKQVASDTANRLDLRCPTAYLQQQCQHWDTARRWELQRKKEGIVVARKEFVPKGGFSSVYGEMGACVLDKAELLVDIVYQMATCKSYDNYRGSECYEGTAQDFVGHLRMCCAGNTKDGGTESAADCKKLLLPVVGRVTRSVTPLFNKCARDSSKCAPLHSALLDCYEMFDGWKQRNTERSTGVKFGMGLQAWDSTAKEESPFDQFFFTEQESEEHTLESKQQQGAAKDGGRRLLKRRECLSLLQSEEVPVLPVFRDMVSPPRAPLLSAATT